MVTVELPAGLRALAGNQAKVRVDAASVEGALTALCSAHPSLREKLFLENGALKRNVGVFVGDDDVRDEPRRALNDRDVVVLVAAMAGG